MRRLPLIILFAPLACLAHPGHGSINAASGLLHPLTGLDHLLALVAVGWIASLGTNRWERTLLPGLFLGTMTFGTVLAMQFSIAQNVEFGIGLSLVLLGALVACARRIRAVGCILVAAGLYHGFAHGGEMPTGSSPYLYLGGMLASSTALLVAGTFLHRQAQRHHVPLLARFAFSGALLLTGAGKLFGWA